MALGACGTDVLGVEPRPNMKWVFAGLVLGVAGSLGIGGLLGSLLYGVRPANPAVPGMVSAPPAGLAFLASFVPARRAANLDPISTFRHQ